MERSSAAGPRVRPTYQRESLRTETSVRTGTRTSRSTTMCDDEANIPTGICIALKGSIEACLLSQLAISAHSVLYYAIRQYRTSTFRGKGAAAMGSKEGQSVAVWILRCSGGGRWPYGAALPCFTIPLEINTGGVRFYASQFTNYSHLPVGRSQMSKGQNVRISCHNVWQ